MLEVGRSEAWSTSRRGRAYRRGRKDRSLSTSPWTENARASSRLFRPWVRRMILRFPMEPVASTRGRSGKAQPAMVRAKISSRAAFLVSSSVLPSRITPAAYPLRPSPMARTRRRMRIKPSSMPSSSTAMRNNRGAKTVSGGEGMSWQKASQGISRTGAFPPMDARTRSIRGSWPRGMRVKVCMMIPPPTGPPRRSGSCPAAGDEGIRPGPERLPGSSG